MRLSLDHITAVDTRPLDLVNAASRAGCDGVCLFLEPMDVLPLMPSFDLIESATARRELAARMTASGVALDLAYPFTLTGRTDVDAFGPPLACAAELGGSLVNALLYDRDPARRLDRFGAFADLAARHGLGVAVEFYPPSQIASLSDALALVGEIARPGRVGVNVDILHLMRSGGTAADLAEAPRDLILYGQICDGPATIAPELRDEEAASARLLPGEGDFEIAAFVAALPDGCPVSVEIPRDAAIARGESLDERVGKAVAAVRRALASG